MVSLYGHGQKTRGEGRRQVRTARSESEVKAAAHVTTQSAPGLLRGLCDVSSRTQGVVVKLKVCVVRHAAYLSRNNAWYVSIVSVIPSFPHRRALSFPGSLLLIETNSRLLLDPAEIDLVT